MSFHGENEKRRLRSAAVFLLLFSGILAAAALSVGSGNVDISPGTILRILFSGEGNTNEINIIRLIRLPRVFSAAVLGGALALSGFLLQTFFGNPIAGPFVLGISSGAKMAVALVMIAVLAGRGYVSSWALIGAAFAGAFIATLFVLAVSRIVHDMAMLLVAGIMIGYICSAITDFLITFADDSDIVNLHGWSLGSFSGMNMENAALAAGIVFAAFLAVMALAKPISAYQMGEAYARSLGVPIRLFRFLLITLSGILSATVTAFAGPISFVGIAVPFLVKRALGTSKPLAVIPGCFLGGALFCLVSDLIARMAFAPTELNISTVTSILGAPVVIFMLIRAKRR